MTPGWWQAALTKPGRASTARWCGSGERDGKEYARNRRLRLSSVERLKSGGYGLGAVRTCLFGRGTHGSAFDGWPGDHGEVLRVAVVMPQGPSRAPPSSSESQ